MRRRGHQQEMVRPFGVRQPFTELVGERLLVLAVGAHLVRLIDDDEIPATAQQALLGVFDSERPRTLT